MWILAIESSCDETACAIVEDGVKEISSQIASSADLHHVTGGIVPEVAARKQVEFIVPVLQSVINSTPNAKNRVDAIAITVGPGLAGSLIVGIEAAKALALAWNKPLIPVNHLVGHIYANFVNTAITDSIFPSVVLVVSGGHTDLVLMKGHGNMEYLGGTLDDAAGEAFDKVARLLGFGMYLGGADLSKAAAGYNGPTLPEKFPRALINENNYDFSFSGLKTAVKRMHDHNIYPVEAIAKEFEESVVDVLVQKTLRAVRATGARSILLGGGVAANSKLRHSLKQSADDAGISLFVPPLRLCSDNAVYIASAAYFNQAYKPYVQISPRPSLTIKEGGF